MRGARWSWLKSRPSGRRSFWPFDQVGETCRFNEQHPRSMCRAVGARRGELDSGKLRPEAWPYLWKLSPAWVQAHGAALRQMKKVLPGRSRGHETFFGNTFDYLSRCPYPLHPFRARRSFPPTASAVSPRTSPSSNITGSKCGILGSSDREYGRRTSCELLVLVWRNGGTAQRWAGRFHAVAFGDFRSF